VYERVILVNYHEIGPKRRNRGRFERTLHDNLAAAPGPGGLPVGTSVKVLVLLSAGIDSPVAGWRTMRRDAVLVAVHFLGRLSTRLHADCCALFMPCTPKTHATVAQVEAGEVGLDLEWMVSDVLSAVTYVDYPCPSYRAPARWPDRDEVRS